MVTQKHLPLQDFAISTLRNSIRRRALVLRAGVSQLGTRFLKISMQLQQVVSKYFSDFRSTLSIIVKKINVVSKLAGF